MQSIRVRVRLRDSATLDDLGELTAPAPVEPGDLGASSEALYRVDAVLVTPPDTRCIPVLVACLRDAGAASG